MPKGKQKAMNSRTQSLGQGYQTIMIHERKVAETHSTHLHGVVVVAGKEVGTATKTNAQHQPLPH